MTLTSLFSGCSEPCLRSREEEVITRGQVGGEPSAATSRRGSASSPPPRGTALHFLMGQRPSGATFYQALHFFQTTESPSPRLPAAVSQPTGRGVRQAGTAREDWSRARLRPQRHQGPLGIFPSASQNARTEYVVMPNFSLIRVNYWPQMSFICPTKQETTTSVSHDCVTDCGRVSPCCCSRAGRADTPAGRWPWAVTLGLIK